MYSETYVESGRLIRVLAEYEVSSSPGLFIVYPSRHHLSPKVRVFVDFLVEHSKPVRVAPSTLERRDGLEILPHASVDQFLFRGPL